MCILNKEYLFYGSFSHSDPVNIISQSQSNEIKFSVIKKWGQKMVHNGLITHTNKHMFSLFLTCLWYTFIFPNTLIHKYYILRWLPVSQDAIFSWYNTLKEFYLWKPQCLWAFLTSCCSLAYIAWLIEVTPRWALGQANTVSLTDLSLSSLMSKVTNWLGQSTQSIWMPSFNQLANIY